MTHVEKSLELFKSDFNCSQSVFATFSEELGLSEKQALKIGGCFGSGMRKGEVCGACTGALMALGLKYGHNEIGDTENGSYLCNELLKCDITTKEGVEYAKENNLFNEFCPNMVASAVKIVEKILNE